MTDDLDKLNGRLDTISGSLTNILIEQGKLVQSVERLLIETALKDEVVNSLEKRVITIEGTVTVLKWVGGIIGAATSVMLVRMLTIIFGG